MKDKKRVKNIWMFFFWIMKWKKWKTHKRGKQKIEKKKENDVFFQDKWKVNTQFLRRSEKSKNENEKKTMKEQFFEILFNQGEIQKTFLELVFFWKRKDCLIKTISKTHFSEKFKKFFSFFDLVLYFSSTKKIIFLVSYITFVEMSRYRAWLRQYVSCRWHAQIDKRSPVWQYHSLCTHSQSMREHVWHESCSPSPSAKHVSVCHVPSHTFTTW